MAKGNGIIVSGEPKGVYKEGIVSGTPKPGTIMEMVPATADVNGHFTWAVYGTDTSSTGAVSADGDRAPIVVLLSDPTKGPTTAYADGDNCFLYCPIMGEELNVLMQGSSGTEGSPCIGDKFIVDDGTGELILTTGTVEAEPFIALEAVTEPAADTLVWCMYTGY